MKVLLRSFLCCQCWLFVDVIQTWYRYIYNKVIEWLWDKWNYFASMYNDIRRFCTYFKPSHTHKRHWSNCWMDYVGCYLKWIWRLKILFFNIASIIPIIAFLHFYSLALRSKGYCCCLHPSICLSVHLSVHPYNKAWPHDNSNTIF